MPSDLLNIGRSGAAAARAALDVTAQNIANANSPDYTRRSLAMAEVNSTGSVAYYSSSALSGVRVEQIRRTDSLFLQNEARRTGSDAARASAELAGLRSAESGLEQAGLYPAIVEFEAALGQLRGDPVNGSLRAAVLESARVLADSFRLADGALVANGEQLRFEAGAGVDAVNAHARELARINVALVKTQRGTTAHVTLLDQRDTQLRNIAEQIGIAVSYDPTGAATVRLDQASGPLLVERGTAGLFGVAAAPDGTIAFTLDGNSAAIGAGALAGQALGLTTQRDLRGNLDALAAQIVAIANTAQANGTAQDGNAGQIFFSGSTAGDIVLALTDGAGIAAAAAGAPAGSRDTANLDALRSALATGGPAAGADRLLFRLANTIAGRSIMADALTTIAGAAQTTLASESAVDLDAEAANLVRYQQAFQASGRVIQTAADIFDTILAIR